jgi:hypothetical protein
MLMASASRQQIVGWHGIDLILVYFEDLEFGFGIVVYLVVLSRSGTEQASDVMPSVAGPCLGE